MTGSIYTNVSIYQVAVICSTPLHVGSGEGEMGEVLVHPVTGRPFIQASGIAGSFRSHAEKQFPDSFRYWFGDSYASGENDVKSRLIFTDAEFLPEKFKMELRTRVSIDRETGTTATAGNDRKSGQVLQTEYVSRGSEAQFTIYEYRKEDEKQRIIEPLLKALDDGIILFGGQLSNGCGQVELISVERIDCDMKTAEGRKYWRNPKTAKKTSCLKQIRKLPQQESEYIDFYMDMKFNQAVLVKGTMIDQQKLEEMTGRRFDKKTNRLPNVMPLMDGERHFIIPGSSFKGVFRSHIKTILEYLKADPSGKLEDYAFMNRSRLFFYDVPVDSGVSMQVRIHVDKFTGSVMDKALMKEAIAGGDNANCTLHMRLMKDKKEDTQRKKYDKILAALILLTMRDCAIGNVSVGSGYSIGRGFMDVTKIKVCDGGEVLMDYTYETGNKNEFTNAYIKECLQLLGELRTEENA